MSAMSGRKYLHACGSVPTPARRLGYLAFDFMGNCISARSKMTIARATARVG